jgi:hypothetical protein
MRLCSTGCVDGLRVRWGLRTSLWFCLILVLAARPVCAQTAAEEMVPVLTLQLPTLAPGQRLTGNAKASAAYLRATQDLTRRKIARAAHEAGQAVRWAPESAPAWTLAATVSLAEYRFDRAAVQAAAAGRLAPQMIPAWIVLATAENYRDHYAAALAALSHVSFSGEEPWQADYQRARAAAGLEQGAAVLLWSNRAALSAPAGFAPLHLLRASALANTGQYRAASEELAAYLRLIRNRSVEAAGLRRELKRLQALASIETPHRIPVERVASGN